MKDFIHKTLINAGGKDAVSNMLTGAAMGAGANTALGAIQGDFDIIGNFIFTSKKEITNSFNKVLNHLVNF